MRTSEKTNEIIAALVKVQSELKSAVKKTYNEFTKKNYADFASVVEASRPALVANGLAIMQAPELREQGWVLVTRLTHLSDQWVESEFPLVAKDNTAQGMGSAMTYARRYSWAGLVGVAVEDDDDGEAASKTPKAKKPIVTPTQSSQKTNVLPTSSALNKNPVPQPMPTDKVPFSGISENELKTIEFLASQLGWDKDMMRNQFYNLTGKKSSNYWDRSDIDYVLRYMKNYKTNKTPEPGSFADVMGDS